MEIVPFAGWARNARITCGDQELIVTLEVGPRILSYGFTGGPNLMAVHSATAGQTGGDRFVSYGGHRLWIAPEMEPRTFTPDNEPVAPATDGEWFVFTGSPDQFHIQREMRIRPDTGRSCFVLEHRIYNHGAYPVDLAPWTPTQFATGGECIFPMPAFIPHSERVLPARPMVLWHYTDLSDERYTWGSRVSRLKWMDRPPTKVGMLVDQGYVAFAHSGNLHLRRFECLEGAAYPDFGCNFETFTRTDMLEVETLGPMQAVAPGSFATHQETWYLLKDHVPPEDDGACGDWLAELASTRPL